MAQKDVLKIAESEEDKEDPFFQNPLKQALSMALKKHMKKVFWKQGKCGSFVNYVLIYARLTVYQVFPTPFLLLEGHHDLRYQSKLKVLWDIKCSLPPSCYQKDVMS